MEKEVEQAEASALRWKRASVCQALSKATSRTLSDDERHEDLFQLLLECDLLEEDSQWLD